MSPRERPSDLSTFHETDASSARRPETPGAGDRLRGGESTTGVPTALRRRLKSRGKNFTTRGNGSPSRLSLFAYTRKQRSFSKGLHDLQLCQDTPDINTGFGLGGCEPETEGTRATSLNLWKRSWLVTPKGMTFGTSRLRDGPGPGEAGSDLHTPTLPRPPRSPEPRHDNFLRLRGQEGSPAPILWTARSTEGSSPRRKEGPRRRNHN